MAGTTLRIKALSKAFHQNVVLNKVDLTFAPGETHVLVGENGAGKSTLLKLIAGVYQPDGGAIYLNDTQCAYKTPRDAFEAGIAMVYQELSLLPEMTVFDNVFLGHEQTNHVCIIQKKEMRERLRRICTRFQIQIDQDEYVKDMPLSKQLMVEVAKVLMMEPDVVIFDEATSALDNEEVKCLKHIIEILKSENKTVVFISHRMDEVFAIGDKVSVLKDGEVIVTANTDEINEDQVIEYMVGRTVREIFPSKAEELGSSILEIKNLGRKDRQLEGISFTVHQNEIVGIAGLKGHKQDLLLECIAGVKKYQMGSIALKGVLLKAGGVDARIRKGVILMPEERKTQALFLNHSIRKNLAVSSLRLRQNAGVILQKVELAFVREKIGDLSVKCVSEKENISILSGGNQQKVILGRVLGILPQVILFNEPTRGIDVKTKQDILKRIRVLAREGICVIFYSSDLLEVVGLSDTVYTMYEGKITRKLQDEQINEVDVMKGSVGSVRDYNGSNGEN